MEVDDGEGGQKQTVRLVKGPITGNGDEECDARLQGERGKAGKEGRDEQAYASTSTTTDTTLPPSLLILLRTICRGGDLLLSAA